MTSSTNNNQVEKKEVKKSVLNKNAQHNVNGNAPAPRQSTASPAKGASENKS